MLFRELQKNQDLVPGIKLRLVTGTTPVTGKSYGDLTIEICKPDIVASITPASGTLIEHTGTASGGLYELQLIGSDFNITGNYIIEVSGADFDTRPVEVIVSENYIDNKLNVSGTLAHTDNASSFKATGYATSGSMSTHDTNIKALLEHADYGLSKLKDYADILDDGTNGLANIRSLIDTIDGIVDDIKDKTKNLPTNTTTEFDNIDTAIGAVKTVVDLTATDAHLVSGTTEAKDDISVHDADIKTVLSTTNDKIDVINTNVNDIETMTIRALGLMQENCRIVNPVYDASHNLTSGTFKIYGNKTDCDNNENETDTYSITATYTGIEMTSYKMTKDV